MTAIRTIAIALLGSVGVCVTSGCGSQRHRDIPADAKIVTQGQTDLTYRAHDDGTIYVFDKSAQNMLYSGRLQRDEVLKVEAMRDRITVDDRVVMDEQIRDHNAINIFFKPEPFRDRSFEARPADATIIRETEIRTQPQPRSDSSVRDGTITLHPDRDKVTVQGSSDSKVTIEQPNSDSKVTIERQSDQR